MTVSEAHCVNTLAEHLVVLRHGRPSRFRRGAGLGPPTEEQVLEAICYLADRAYKRLLAGIDGDVLRGLLELPAKDGSATPGQPGPAYPAGTRYGLVRRDNLRHAARPDGEEGP